MCVVFLTLIVLLPYSANNPILKINTKVKTQPKNDYELVSVTMYTIAVAQTDSFPLETASGFIVDSLNPKKHRIIAVSHDLKKKFKWGERVKLKGVGKWSGVYVVRDLMNARWKNKIDILINPDEEAISFKRAKLFKLKI
jgi:3D (Asp-Asp-Asp) domain-containing protein